MRIMNHRKAIIKSMVLKKKVTFKNYCINRLCFSGGNNNVMEANSAVNGHYDIRKHITGNNYGQFMVYVV